MIVYIFLILKKGFEGAASCLSELNNEEGKRKVSISHRENGHNYSIELFIFNFKHDILFFI